MAKPNDLVQGTLDLLILKTLALQPMHGRGIAQRIRQVSKDVLQINKIKRRELKVCANWNRFRSVHIETDRRRPTLVT
jgi:hypothetical protein